MKTIEKNLPELKALCDDQAGRALEMYQIMKSSFQIIEDMDRRPDLCTLRQEGARQLRKNIVEYITLLDKVADGCVPLSNMR